MAERPGLEQDRADDERRVVDAPGAAQPDDPGERRPDPARDVLGEHRRHLGLERDPVRHADPEAPPAATTSRRRRAGSRRRARRGPPRGRPGRRRPASGWRRPRRPGARNPGTRARRRRTRAGARRARAGGGETQEAGSPLQASLCRLEGVAPAMARKLGGDLGSLGRWRGQPEPGDSESCGISPAGIDAPGDEFWDVSRSLR